MLCPSIFKRIVNLMGMPEIDLFASCRNEQLIPYVLWKPDPHALFVDALASTWNDFFFYAFPPFSLISRCLKKIQQEKAQSILSVPNWPSQHWFSMLFNDHCYASPATLHRENSDFARGTPVPTFRQETPVTSLPLVRQSLRQKGLSSETADIILSSWRLGTISSIERLRTTVTLINQCKCIQTLSLYFFEYSSQCQL